MDENRITYFAETDARNKKARFGIKAKDRTRHVYAIGKTGMGKSTMLENMAVQDIQNGEGMCFIDPHGKTADLLLEYVPKERIRDVVYIAPFDVEHPISFNVLEAVDRDKRHLVSSGLMSTFKKIWEDAWSARMEYILTNTLLALLEYPGSTLLGVNRMLSDKDYRKEVVAHIQDPSVKAFWVKEFANYTERMAAEAVPAIQNKVGQFTANPLIRNMIGQPQSSFDFRRAMDERKIIIINLSKGKIGDENMKLLGGLLVTKIYLAAMSRADVPDRVMKILPNFYLYVDEFQNFANASFADILSEARKYKLNLTIAHQYVEQMDEIVRPAVFGNVGTMITFRVGATDAELLEKEFAPVFTMEDLVNLGFTQVYLKLMIDGLSSQPFSATTLPPIAHPDISYVKEIIDSSREQFSRPRAGVEEEIVKFHLPTLVKKSDSGTPANSPASLGSMLHAAQSKPSAAPSSVSKTPLVNQSAPASFPAKQPFNATISIKPQPDSISAVENHASAPHLDSTSNLSDATKMTSKNSQPISENPETHKPFAVLKQLVPEIPKPDLISPKEIEINEPVARPVSVVPAQPEMNPMRNEAIKPSNITTPPQPTFVQKPDIQKANSKAQTPQNVAALKNALAAALSKSASTSPAPSTTASPSVSNSTNAVTNTGDRTNVERPISTAPKSPQEVPEEVLKNVLNVPK